MNNEVIKECTSLSEQEKIAFPDVVACLNDVRVESYYADLLNSTKTYYSENEAFSISSISTFEKKINADFNASKVIQAIRLSQSGKIKYQEFLKQVMEAGVISYFVFINGRKAIYFGRKGEQHIEKFPSKL